MLLLLKTQQTEILILSSLLSLLKDLTSWCKGRDVYKRQSQLWGADGLGHIAVEAIFHNPLFITGIGESGNGDDRPVSYTHLHRLRSSAGTTVHADACRIYIFTDC